MAELFLSAFVTLFVVIDPPGCAPIYAGLTKGASAQQRRNMAVRACLIAGAILLVFALFGVRVVRRSRWSAARTIRTWTRRAPYLTEQ